MVSYLNDSVVNGRMSPRSAEFNDLSGRLRVSSLKSLLFNQLPGPIYTIAPKNL